MEPKLHYQKRARAGQYYTNPVCGILEILKLAGAHPWSLELKRLQYPIYREVVGRSAIR